MKFQYPTAPQMDRRQLLLGGGGAVVVIAAIAAFLLLRPTGDPEASASGVSAADRARAAREAAIARHAAAAKSAPVAQAGAAGTPVAALKAGTTKAAPTPAPATAAKPAPATPSPATPATATPATATTVAAPAAKAAPVPATDSGVVIEREQFGYEPGGRRDPFTSLMTSQDLRPAASDLRLTGILWHPTRPIAVLRDATMQNQQYRVTVGSVLGRMRVVQIDPKKVFFTIEEFGYSRRDSLILGDTTQVRAR